MSTPGKVPGGEVAIYEATDGSVRVDVRLEKDTVWLTQRQMAELFESSTDNIGLHWKKIFADNELREATTTEDFSVVQSEGSRSIRRRVKHYNLDAIISVGYRINSHRGVRFRQWATTTLVSIWSWLHPKPPALPAERCRTGDDARTRTQGRVRRGADH